MAATAPSRPAVPVPAPASPGHRRRAGLRGLRLRGVPPPASMLPQIMPPQILLPRIRMPLVLLAGFAVAVGLRCAIGGAAVARSYPAGFAFAAALGLLAAVGTRPEGLLPDARLVPRRLAVGFLVGVAGAAVLCIPAVLAAVSGSQGVAVPHAGLLPWTAVVAVVASAEEAFLRGTLYRLLVPFGTLVAVGVPALAFAALHVPLYGWGAAPLDLAAGVWLGALRAVSGSWTAPAVAHVLADWAAWGLG